MAGYETIEHTADVGLHVWADDLGGLFAESARALIGMMGHVGGPQVHSERVSLDAGDLDGLYVDWLSEVLFLFEARGVVPEQVDVDVTEDPWRVQAVVVGPDAEGFVQEGPAVKAVTYHGLEIDRRPDEVHARVYLDV